MGGPGLPNPAFAGPEQRGGPEQRRFLGVSGARNVGHPRGEKTSTAMVLRRNGPAHRSHPEAGVVTPGRPERPAGSHGNPDAAKDLWLQKTLSNFVVRTRQTPRKRHNQQ